MSSGAKVIKSSLRLTGGHSSQAPADPESISIGMDVLNGMLQEWESDGIVLGTTPLKVPGDELNEPLDARNAIIANLAIELAPNLDNGKIVVSQDLRDSARRGYARVQRAYEVVVINRKKIPSTLPRGEGAGTSRFNDGIYFYDGDSFDG